MPISKIVTDLYSIRQNIEIKKHTVPNVLVVKGI